MPLISPSILSADFLTLGQEIESLEKAGADLIHIDVMDGHFVPNLTVGPLIVKALKRATKVKLDVHLMINNAERYIDDYVKSGADFLTVHTESCTHLDRTIRHIKSLGAKAGVALNPSTHESAIQYLASDLDLILVMSVNPGFAAQKFLTSTIEKIRSLKTMLHRAGNTSCIISVDGGINEQNAKKCIDAGASCLVAGSYIFNQKDYALAIGNLKK